MHNLLWWLRQIALTAVGIFFLLFGILLLRSAYALDDPFTFIITFFSSNLIILISGALLIGFVYRMFLFNRSSSSDNG